MGYQFAIIGCGHIGARHAGHIAAAGTLVGVCDIIQERADKLAAEFGCKAWYNAEEMLEKEQNIDIVSICSPNYLHEAHTIASLNAGHHVICEKPMAISSESCRKMIAAAEKNGRQVFVVKQNRYNPPVQAVKELIDKGILGNILQVNVNCFWNRDPAYYAGSDWKGKKARDGGILFTQFSHFIDVLFYLVGPVSVISGTSANFQHEAVTDFEDSAAFLLRTQNGAIISLNASTCAWGKNMEGSITLLAENGSIRIGGQYLNTIDYSNIKGHELPAISISNQNNQYGAYEGSMSNHHLVIKNVIDTLDGKAKAMTNADEGMRVVELIEEMYKKVES